MLSDNQLEYIGAEFAALFQQMEQDIIRDVARRVAKTSRWTETAELQAGTLREMGYSPAEIYRNVLEKLGADSEYRTLVKKNTIEHKQMVTEAIKRTVEEAKAKGDDLVSQAGNMAFRNDMSLWKKGGKVLTDKSAINQIIRFYQTQLAKEVGGLTGSTGFIIKGERPISTEDIYHKELDRMLVNVTSGAFTTEQAINESMKRMTQSGVRYVHFDSGVSRNIDTAMRLAIQTTSSQMAGSITMNNLDTTGEDLVEVTSHAGARNDGIGCMNHASWQGKVYSISGAPHEEESKRLGYKIQKLEDVTGYPSDPTGLCGYNCRHTFHVFFEGISEPNEPEKEPEPFVWHGKTYDHYHARQKQRQMEREIREVKRKVACGVEKQMALLTNKELQYRAFCEHAGLTMNMGRLDVVNARSSLWLLEKREYKSFKYNPKSKKLVDRIKYSRGKLEFKRGECFVTARKVKHCDNLYVSKNAKGLTQRDIANLNDMINEAYSLLGEDYLENRPNIIIMPLEEFQRVALASFNRVTGDIYMPDTFIKHDNEVLATIIHELVHAKQFERVNEVVGKAKKIPITKYDKITNELAKKEVDKFIENGYDVRRNRKVYDYFSGGEYAEVEAEAIAIKLSGRRK